jgi:hypothetical protein
MESAEDWDRCDAAALLGPSKIWRIFSQWEVRPDPVVIGSVIPQQASQLCRVEHNQVIEGFAPNRANEPIDVAVLTR